MKLQLNFRFSPEFSDLKTLSECVYVVKACSGIRLKTHTVEQ